jgi:hypothetical protein
VWVAPVLAPMLCAGTLMALGVALLGPGRGLGPLPLALLGTGALLMIGSFVQQTPSPELPLDFVPHWFNWPLYAAGEGLWLLALWRLWRQPISTKEGR